MIKCESPLANPLCTDWIFLSVQTTDHLNQWHHLLSVLKNKHSAPFSSGRVSWVAASRSIKFELIGYSPACLCSFQNWESGNFPLFHLRRQLGAYSLYTYNFMESQTMCHDIKMALINKKLFVEKMSELAILHCNISILLFISKTAGYHFPWFI